MSEDGDSPLYWPSLYTLADVDDQSGYPHYYGFIAYNGSYYVMKEASSGSVMYFKKEFGARGSYSQSWSSRTRLAYTYWDNAF